MGAFCTIRGHEEILKKSSSPKLPVRFWNNFTGMFLWWPFSKMFAKFWSVHKHGSGEWGLLAPYGHEGILKKSSPKLLVRFWNNFTGMFLGWPFQKLFAKFWSVCKYGSGEWGLFALYRHEEIHVCIVQKNLVLRNHWSDFEIISQESCFDISRHPDSPIRIVIATGKLPWPFVSLLGK